MVRKGPEQLILTSIKHNISTAIPVHIYRGTLAVSLSQLMGARIVVCPHLTANPTTADSCPACSQLAETNPKLKYGRFGPVERDHVSIEGPWKEDGLRRRG